MIPEFQTRRKAFLVGTQTPGVTHAALEDSLTELADLAVSMGFEVCGRLSQTIRGIHPATFLGSGKVEELKDQAKNRQADLVIFDNNLSPTQGENLEAALKVMVLDRTQLILEIFHKNARTHESRIQVELAQLEYMLPRLVGMWAHLDRERGGISGTKGTGEKQINIDRGIIRARISRLKKELAHISRERDTQKKRRAKNCLLVSLVGYTNAGKSTLMNRLTKATVKVEDRLFATLDSTTRVLMGEKRPMVLLSDTVGFIQRLPHQLVASFRSTLEVVRDADLLLHVVDVSHPDFQAHIQTTESVLNDFDGLIIPRILVFNKVDRVEDKVQLMLLKKNHPDGLFMSVLTDDLQPMVDRIATFFEKQMVTTPLFLAYQDSRGLSEVYRWGRVDEVRYEEDGIHLRVTSTPANIERLRSLVHLDEESTRHN